jgi:hypothetical protein
VDRSLVGWACLVVDLDPTSKREAVKNVGKDSYSTEREAKADLKRVCEE